MERPTVFWFPVFKTVSDTEAGHSCDTGQDTQQFFRDRRPDMYGAITQA
ncbi:hypothetical protein [Bifidobacterium crudilactis]|uniref:Uncharacterized protein n=1 Tax=Bifidobacterium crudilactis TaxID=327277 RepID=A0A971ICM9_9BIFI|nr:hypothetical protein [Bifidobacterium crudilactis]MCI1868949.1 hypothetical protein [Bifidobacterium crudilactis]MDN5972686.1 hypothetical protein [Bifidobacterium crudilactis]MDN6000596.1 hypothetical protein [Bifidobacterium crudilactis]MDN6210557.1 hypothetical protein [Bifidobacterium crudilactis]MDN6272085.1 hypothetical protein [Bifidobacterium crudilactis]